MKRNSFHRHSVYSLDPVKAYDMELVKQIEVGSVMDDRDKNIAYVTLDKVICGKNSISTKK